MSINTSKQSKDCALVEANNKDQLVIDIYGSHKVLGFLCKFGIKESGGVVGNEIRNFLNILLLFFCIPFLCFTISALSEGTLFMRDINVGWFEDTPIIVLLLVVSLVVYAAKKVFNKVAGLLIALQYAINHSKYDIKKLARLKREIETVTKGEGSYAKPKIAFYGACLGIAILYVIYYFFLFSSPWDHWHSSLHPLSFALFSAYIFIVLGYFIPAVAWPLIGTIKSMRDLCAKPELFIIRPLAPDRAGGLKPLGDLALSLNIVVAIPMIQYISAIFCWGFTTGSLISSLIYIPLLIIVFFLPLSKAHRIMAKAKNEELKRLSDEFNKVYDEVYLKMTKTDKISLSETSPAFDRMRDINALYGRAENMPIWPFDISIFIRFAGTVVIPTILVIAEILCLRR